jgi:hypothetical protein
MSYSATAAAGLNPSDIINVSVSLQAAAAQAPTQSIPLILGDSTVIPPNQRIMTFTGGAAGILPSMLALFGPTAPEYLAAVQLLDYTPQLPVIKVGRWLSTATQAYLFGQTLSVSNQALSRFTAITNGSMNITLGVTPGAVHTVTGLNLSSATSLAGVAALLQTAIGNVQVSWDPINARFVIATNLNSPLVIITFATVTGSGVDVSALLGLQATQGGSVFNGVAPELPSTAITILRGVDKSWYYLHFAATDPNTALTPAQCFTNAQVVQALQPPATYGISTMDPQTGNPASTTDVMSLITAGGFTRTWVFYSSTNAYAALEAFAIFGAVDYTGSFTATIAMFKTLPGVIPELITEGFASALKSKNGNVYTYYSNGVAIIQFGTMGSGNYFDEIHSTDALSSTAQTAMFNALSTTQTKVPQTDGGMAVLKAVLAKVCQQFVANGVLGPNLTWQGPPVGTVNTGDVLPKGYYIYQQPLNLQSVAARQARQAPLFQILGNLAGAVQGASIQILVTR